MYVSLTHIHIYFQLAQFKVSHRCMTSGLTIWNWITSCQLVCPVLGKTISPNLSASVAYSTLSICGAL